MYCRKATLEICIPLQVDSQTPHGSRAERSSFDFDWYQAGSRVAKSRASPANRVSQASRTYGEDSLCGGPSGR